MVESDGNVCLCVGYMYIVMIKIEIFDLFGVDLRGTVFGFFWRVGS